MQYKRRLGGPVLIVMERAATDEDVGRVVAAAERLGLKAHPIPGAQRTAIGLTGNKGAIGPAAFENLPGVREVLQVSHPYKLVSREFHPEDSVVPIGGVPVGGAALVVVAGPCAVESREQMLAVAREVKRLGAHLLRGGAFKPRTSPYSFQGLGEAGLKLLAEAREATGLPVVTEVLDTENVDLVAEWADCLQIGARNMQNFELLKKAGKTGKPILLKRGMSATLEEFLLAAEYVLAEGNPNVVLCERGVRTFSDFTRNTLDLAIVPAVERLSHLPIVVDPSHGTGRRDKVIPMSCAAVASGADGLLVEVHHKPEEALSDGPQALTPALFEALMGRIRPIAAAVGRTA
jgi:3-deoxy-7-phosphoheptulonate synthase